jgi:hypothetical protein
MTLQDIKVFIDVLDKVVGRVPMDMSRLATIQTDHNNWVIPGYVMAGPYPGLDGLNFADEHHARASVNGILAEGIDAFVCLASELPSQLTYDQSITHAYFPKYKSYAQTIQEVRPMGTHGLIFEHLPFPDQTAPSERHLLAILTRILRHLADGRKVFIHCAGGHGRTGVVVACLLLCLFPDISVDYALYFTQNTHNMRRVQDVRCKQYGLPVQSPNSPAQFVMVKKFAQTMVFLRKACMPS